MLPPGFYNQVDKDIYAAGDFFIPQERFRAAPYNVNQPNNPDPPVGIPAVYQAQGGSGGGGYTGGISNLTGDFFKTTSDRQDRLKELNRSLTTFPSFKGARTSDLDGDPYGLPGMKGFSANEMYNRAAAAKAAGQDTMPSFAGITNVDEAMKYADDRIQDHRMRYATGQLGPSVIREKPTFNRRIQDFFYDDLGFRRPQSADQIIAEGYTGRVGGPGIAGMLLGMVDKYGELPRGDQAFIARNMGYTGPTVFGENASGLGKDVFGLNTRSALGNYAEAVGEQVDKLGASLSADGAIGGKKDYQGATFNEATGMFEADDDDPSSIAAARKANQMTKMVRAKYNFYQQQVAQRDADRKAAEEARMRAYQESQMKKERDIIQSRLNDEGVTGSNYNQAANISGGGGGDTATYGGQTAREATYDNDPSTGTAQGYSQHYMNGGIVDMLEIYD
jgi:hypothetical protein